MAARGLLGQSRDRDGSRHVRQGPGARRPRTVVECRGGSSRDRPPARVVQGLRDLDAESESREVAAAAKCRHGSRWHRRDRRQARPRMGLHQSRSLSATK